MLRIKRIYEAPAPDDGYRVLVDRLWPRGLKRESARIDFWAKQLAPSTELCKWFAGEEGSWSEFVRRYRKELEAAELAGDIEDLRSRARKGTVTLLYAKRDIEENNAAALRDVLEVRAAPR